MTKNTKRFCNFINMNMLIEQQTIGQVIKTSDILNEVSDRDPKNFKKAYNYRLVNDLGQ